MTRYQKGQQLVKCTQTGIAAAYFKGPLVGGLRLSKLARSIKKVLDGHDDELIIDSDMPDLSADGLSAYPDLAKELEQLASIHIPFDADLYLTKTLPAMQS